jgi:hypothetical protein
MEVDVSVGENDDCRGSRGDDDAGVDVAGYHGDGCTSTGTVVMGMVGGYANKSISKG